MGNRFRECYEQMNHYAVTSGVNYGNYAALSVQYASVMGYSRPYSRPFSLGYFIDRSSNANVLVLTTIETNLSATDLLNPRITPWIFYSNIREIILKEGLRIAHVAGQGMGNRLDAIFLAVPHIGSRNHRHYLQYLSDRLAVPVYAPQGDIEIRSGVVSGRPACFCVRDAEKNQLISFFPKGENPSAVDPFWV
ncbi:hypothetical protein [Xenorhabdus bovienii]|uniref:hypothetical protein n=1 Tax=Xenorhabdus bovienii TaxID=40576 RepID=UPI0023B2D873|nr:hypothetical protein [Xenorhabdus bovienii]MDE9484142.1 hypothetical protein [Xenorhabdus bovienii]MDE9545051.1 hypothetical protein [Xenorhabdus bovienii]